MTARVDDYYEGYEFHGPISYYITFQPLHWTWYALWIGILFSIKLFMNLHFLLQAWNRILHTSWLFHKIEGNIEVWFHCHIFNFYIRKNSNSNCIFKVFDIVRWYYKTVDDVKAGHLLSPSSINNGTIKKKERRKINLPNNFRQVLTVQ